MPQSSTISVPLHSYVQHKTGLLVKSPAAVADSVPGAVCRPGLEPAPEHGASAGKSPSPWKRGRSIADFVIIMFSSPPSNLNRHQRVGIQAHAKKQKFSPQCTPGFPARQQTGGFFRKGRTFPLSPSLNSRRSGKISGSLLRKADHGGNVRHGPGFAYRSRAFRTPHSASSFFAKFFPSIKPSRFQLCLIHRKAPMDANFFTALNAPPQSDPRLGNPPTSLHCLPDYRSSKDI